MTTEQTFIMMMLERSDMTYRKRTTERIRNLPSASQSPLMLAIRRSIWINEGKAWAA